jgi:cytochrome c oxidase subunit IV
VAEPDAVGLVTLLKNFGGLEWLLFVVLWQADAAVGVAKFVAMAREGTAAVLPIGVP